MTTGEANALGRVPHDDLTALLNALADRYERPAFIAEDPISLPHAFDDPADQEVIGLFAALLAWGRRDVMLRKLAELTVRMDYRPAAFIRTLTPQSERKLEGFKHRTFQPQDALSLSRALRDLLHEHGSIEALIASTLTDADPHIGPGIERLSETLLTNRPETPRRMRKHLARPSTGSACKRLAMYFRWMVRPGPVDLDLWDAVSPRQLLIPLDVHTGRQARRLGLIARKSNDWTAALRLTERCRTLDPKDPARYDYALFGLGAYGGQPIPGDGSSSRPCPPPPHR